MRVIIVGTETTQRFTVGIATQVLPGGYERSNQFDVTLDTLEIQSPELSCTQVKTRAFEHQTTLA